MIISRTPTRISLFGGGTDYPDWYKKNGGSVISACINKYSYITARKLPPFFKYKHRIRYYQQEETNSLDEIKHPSVRECAKFVNFADGLEVVHNADLPAQSGLGSSSAFTVGMLNALYALQSYMPTKRELAVNAIHVEQNLIKENVGSQDQIAAAFGGLNNIVFSENGNFEVKPIVLSQNRVAELEANLMLCFTGFSRSASEVAKIQISNIDKNYDKLQTISKLTKDALDVISQETRNLQEIGEMLDQHWQTKKSLADNISTSEIDTLYQSSKNAGAIGGKLLGAGAGGFFLIFAPPERHEKIKISLGEKLFVPFRFDFTGSSIVYYSHE